MISRRTLLLGPLAAGLAGMLGTKAPPLPLWIDEQIDDPIWRSITAKQALQYRVSLLRAYDLAEQFGINPDEILPPLPPGEDIDTWRQAAARALNQLALGQKLKVAP